MRSHYDQQLELLADRIEAAGEQVELGDAAAGGADGDGSVRYDERLQQTVESLKQRLGLMVFNVCDVEGRALAGDYPQPGVLVPVHNDPVLRRALEGELAAGTVILGPARLQLEGGGALRNAVRIDRSNGGPATTQGTNGDGQVVDEAMMWWAAGRRCGTIAGAWGAAVWWPGVEQQLRAGGRSAEPGVRPGTV